MELTAGVERHHSAAPEAPDQQAQASAAGRPRLQGGPSRLSRRALPHSNSGEVLQDVWLPLVDPGDASRICGRIRVTVRAASIEAMEQQVWRRLLPLADLDGDGRLTAAEFSALLEATGSDLTPEEEAELFSLVSLNVRLRGLCRGVQPAWQGRRACRAACAYSPGSRPVRAAHAGRSMFSPSRALCVLLLPCRRTPMAMAWWMPRSWRQP